MRNYLVLANIVATRILSRSVIAELVKDGRAADDIYPTYDRAQDAHALRTLGESVILENQSVRFLTSPQTYSHFFAPAALFELLLMPAIMTCARDGFGATMMMVFRKTPAPPTPRKYYSAFAAI